MSGLQIEECPECGSRTFVIVNKAGFGAHWKGKCYKCKHEKDIEMP